MSYFQTPFPYNSNSYLRTVRQVQGKMIIEGNGRLTVMPDQAIINIGVMTENNNVEIAQNENSKQSNQVIEALQQLGISSHDIQTLSYTIHPIYDFVEGKSIFKGYQVQHVFEITVFDLQKVGEVYEAAVSAGANMAGSLRFEVSNKDGYYQEALQLAMKNATEKAMKLGQQIGVTIHVPPTKITEESVSIAPKELSISFATETSLQASPPIQKREIEIEAKISAVFQY
ncbi:SIMPL domain-containing protein [Metabacillus bambusae]|uniref:SIMPL domain-containing protein n=1 Tax=Metabacillus bambusae TaxID=2795218 RepID=A0ABS3N289_9BACI|nr:SIMPL domain-containing protein [Metabacillus bambusae]MBO1512033.1 SIMPL domain-containing protein [Metabacillus bambusae]